MKKGNGLVGVILTFFLSGALLTYAQPPMGGGEGRGEPPRRDRDRGPMGFKLSEENQKQFDQRQEWLRVKMDSVMAEKKTLDSTFATMAIWTKDVTPEKIKAIKTKILKLDSVMLEIRFSHLKEVSKLLDDSQKKEWLKMQAMRMNKRPELPRRHEPRDD